MAYRCVRYYPILDLQEELKLELKSELERKPAVEETSEMDVQVWRKLPAELLMRVLSHLPTLIMGKFMVVCKSWGTELHQSQLSVPLCLSPAFLIGGLHGHNDYDRPIHHVYLLQSLPTYPLRKLSLDFFAVCGYVVASCKSLLCYRSYPEVYILKEARKSTPSYLFSICNPITRTCKRLPPIQFYPDFIAMSFDPCAKRCLLVTGVNNNNTGGHRNQLVMEIFDSQSSTWTKSEMEVTLSVFPRGEGLYSRGSFYWINYTPLDQSSQPMFRYDVVAFNVAENHWHVIRRPEAGADVPEFEYHCCWKLTGYDGKVVLVDEIDMSLWKLNIEGCEGPSWSELQAFPKSPYEETVNVGNKRRANACPNSLIKCHWHMKSTMFGGLNLILSSVQLMSAMRGGQERSGLRSRPKLSVKWAPDTYRSLNKVPSPVLSKVPGNYIQ
ncbi:hypothetical protein SUGI_0474130 [Cryptomeria japonica]|nr:hypothetical protein SUGI_0474130 [Cryptomeria japonica]